MVHTDQRSSSTSQRRDQPHLYGEVRGRAPPGFRLRQFALRDFRVDLGGKRIIQRTSGGTRGIVAAGNRAIRLYAASLVTAEATVRALLLGSPDQVSLVAMGENGLEPTRTNSAQSIFGIALRAGRVIHRPFVG
jgi:phosphosulfolactate phosphohydrolase-like enzyme